MQLRWADLSCHVVVMLLSVAIVFPSTRPLDLNVRPEIAHA
jgi:hypothetical protein